MENFKDVPKLEYEKRNEKVILTAGDRLLKKDEIEMLKIALENTKIYYNEIGFDFLEKPEKK